MREVTSLKARAGLQPEWEHCCGHAKAVVHPTIEGMVLENTSREGGSLIRKVTLRLEVTPRRPVRVDSLSLAVLSHLLTRVSQFGAVDEMSLESGRKIGAGFQSKIRRRCV